MSLLEMALGVAVLIGVLSASLILVRVRSVVMRRDLRRRHPRAESIGAGVVLAGAVAAPLVPTPVVSVPTATLVSPAVALGVLTRIRTIRRTQALARDGKHPVLLTQDERETLSQLIELARGLRPGSLVRDVSPSDLPPEVTLLLDSVESAEPLREGPDAVEWTILIRLLGEPVVENTIGERAIFGKKRSIELLCWMALNRERSRRSAARNSLWDTSVTDSTFSTIVSDLRRGLALLASPPERGSWSPTTYGDELPLAAGVITDVDLVASALRSREMARLQSALELVRDVPFAGTSWLWPDLDGSTTRAVITVMDAVRLLVDLGTRTGDTSAVLTATKAGLKVLPGDEDLLRVERELVPGWESSRA